MKCGIIFCICIVAVSIVSVKCKPDVKNASPAKGAAAEASKGESNDADPDPQQNIIGAHLLRDVGKESNIKKLNVEQMKNDNKIAKPKPEEKIVSQNKDNTAPVMLKAAQKDETKGSFSNAQAQSGTKNNKDKMKPLSGAVNNPLPSANKKDSNPSPPKVGKSAHRLRMKSAPKLVQPNLQLLDDSEDESPADFVDSSFISSKPNQWSDESLYDPKSIDNFSQNEKTKLFKILSAMHKYKNKNDNIESKTKYDINNMSEMLRKVVESSTGDNTDNVGDTVENKDANYVGSTTVDPLDGITVDLDEMIREADEEYKNRDLTTPFKFFRPTAPSVDFEKPHSNFDNFFNHKIEKVTKEQVGTSSKAENNTSGVKKMKFNQLVTFLVGSIAIGDEISKNATRLLDRSEASVLGDAEIEKFIQALEKDDTAVLDTFTSQKI